jgi:triosephosphate isomerase (TIM)
MRRKLVVGNWKMNGSMALCRALVPALAAAAGESVAMVVCPPAPYVPIVAALVAGSPMIVGAQNVCASPNGARTGEVSAAMLGEVGCAYAIVGHSERRREHGETDEAVAEKARAAFDAGIVPIICIGETLEERNAGQTRSVIARQLAALIECFRPDELEQCVLAYEPVWAIGTGKTATLDQVRDVHAFIRQCLYVTSIALAERIAILYGGSVRSANAPELFALPGVDGGLIGGASLTLEDFLAIYRAAERSV